MSRFPTPEHLASWAGMCPGNNESAGKHRSGRTRYGSKWLRIALVEAAQAAGRSKDTYLSAQYARIRGRRGPGRAAVAVGHSILVIAWHLLSTGETYTRPDRARGADESTAHQIGRALRTSERNGTDLDDVPEAVRERGRSTLVSDVSSLLELALEPAVE